MTAVTDTTIISAATDNIVTVLRNNITDPVTSRTTKIANSQFVLVKNSQRPLLYPCITVGVVNVTTGLHLGAQTEAYLFDLTVEIEVYSKKNVYVADNIAQQVMDVIRLQNYGTGGFIANNLFQPQLLSITPIVNEQNFGVGGVEMIHRRLLRYKFQYVTSGL